MTIDFRICGVAVAALLAASCGGEKAASENGAASAEEKSAPVSNADDAAGDMAAINAAIASPTRFEGDAADDESRKPAEVLAFIGIEPGMTVLELEGGTGYYTDLFSVLVGDDGNVIMQNPLSFDAFLRDSVDNRLADDRLPNVRHSRTNFDELDVADTSVDLATWILGPHELYFTPGDGVSLGEVGPTYDEIFRVLKPGASFVVLDHSAAPGSPETTGGTLHRIDPAIVKDLAANAGFVIVDESDVLRNADDDYAMGVFDPAVRRKTDRFLIKFKKPE